MTCSCLRADESLNSARRAQAMLGPEIWSEIVLIETSGRSSPYGLSSHALIFECSDILWFYSPRNGTQSLSLRVGQTDLDRADLDRLLREIDPGIFRWRLAGTRERTAADEGGPLRNGCFIESLAALRQRLAAGRPVSSPRLFAFYRGKPTAAKGHTVLVFEHRGQLAVVDPDLPAVVQSFPRQLAEKPFELARKLGSTSTQRTRWLPLSVPVGWYRGDMAGEITTAPRQGTDSG